LTSRYLFSEHTRSFGFWLGTSKTVVMFLTYMQVTSIHIFLMISYTLYSMLA